MLTGSGRHFCAGNDLSEFVTLAPANAAGRMLEVREAFFAIMDAPIPVIGAVHGAALGTGLAIAASCDFVVAAAGATFGLPEVGVGVMGGARHLARLVPEPLLRSMYFTADPVSAEELLAVGGIVAVVEPDRLLDEALARAARIARHSSAALHSAKRSLNAIESMDVKPGYEFEQSLTGELSASPDAKEALLSVIERREPRFSDRS